MATELKLPELAESMTSAAVTAWLKKPGDRVSAGDPIVEVDTDKTTVEVEAPVSGVLREIVVNAGTEDVAVGAVLALIDDDAATGDRVGDVAAVTTPPQVVPPSEVEPTPKAGNVAQPEAPKSQAPARTSAIRRDANVSATPLARRMAVVADLDLSSAVGSGQGGRIVKRDIDRALGREAPAAPEHTEPSLSAMRRVTAKRMAESKRTVPHFYLSADCDMTDLVDRRRHHNDQGIRITITDIIVGAAARALQRVPAANAGWFDDRVRQYAESHVAVAVNTSGGLVVPVIRNAEQKSLGTISSELRALSKRARNGQLNPNEYAGGTFTISNLGMFEVSSLFAIINPPQGCILGVGAVAHRPVVRDGAIEIGQIATLTLSADHRVLDGATGGEFLREIKRLLEFPAPLFDE